MGLIFRIFQIVIVVAFVAISSNSFAGSTASSGQTAPQPGPTSWKDPKFETCGFDCLYQKANENLGLQAKYMAQKLVELEGLGDDSVRRSVLGEFCFANESNSACYDRYKKLQIYALKKVHSAMVQNYDSAAKVSNQSGSKDFHRTYVEGQTNGNAQKKEPQSPYVITWEDLQKEYAALRDKGSRNFQEFADKMPFKPSPEDFVKYEEKPRDPGNPAAGTILVISREKDGKIAIDEAKYKDALDRYEKRMKDVLRDMELAKPQRGQKVSNKSDPADLQSATSPLNKEVFTEARKIIVESSIPAGGRAAIQSQAGYNFKGNNPNPTGNPSPEASKTGSSQTPSGAPDPNSNRKPAKTEVKEMSIEELKKQGVHSLYYSPKNIEKMIETLESELFSKP